MSTLRLCFFAVLLSSLVCSLATAGDNDAIPIDFDPAKDAGSFINPGAQQFIQQNDDQGPLVLLHYCEGPLGVLLDEWTPEKDVRLRRTGEGEWKVSYHDKAGTYSTLRVSGMGFRGGPYIIHSDQDLIVLKKIRRLAWYRVQTLNGYRRDLAAAAQ